MRTHRLRRRILRLAPPLPHRGLLHRPHLSIAGLPDDDVARALRDSARLRVDRAVAGDAPGPGTEDFPAAPGLPRLRPAELHTARPSPVSAGLRDVSPQIRRVYR